MATGDPEQLSLALPAVDLRDRARRVLAALLIGSLGAVLLALALGSVWLDLGALLAPAPDSPARLILALRLPRVLAAYATGALLALSGALMQVLLRNPMGDPYVLGISGGASVGALTVMAFGLGGLSVDAGALSGALLALALVLLPALRWWRQTPGASAGARLLLTGVVLAAGWSALITLILTLAPEERLRGMMFWLMGDLAGVVGWRWPAGVLVVLLFALRPLLADLNAMSRGEAAAFAVGVPVRRRQFEVCLIASVATAVAVTTAGAIGFVGLLVPHAVRLTLGNDQRLLMPASAMLGGSLLVVADTAARTAFAPAQLPVGVLTALLGVPAFLWVLGRGTVR
jgi:iron complex transport system permease protein